MSDHPIASRASAVSGTRRTGGSSATAYRRSPKPLSLVEMRRERERIIAEEVRDGRMEWPDAEIVLFGDAGPGWFV